MTRVAIATAAALVGACGGGGGDVTPDAPPAVDGADAAPDIFNAFVAQPFVWPGGFAEVQLFFQSDTGGTWTLSLEGSGATVELDRTTLDADHPRAYAIVEVPVTQTTTLSLTARATQGSEVREAPVEIGLYNTAEADPGFAVYTAPLARETPSGQPARFRARVVPYGGFAGTVALIAGELTEGFVAARWSPSEVAVAPALVGNATYEVDHLPGTQLGGAPVWGASGRMVKNAEAMATATFTPTAAAPMLRVARRVFAAPGESQTLPVAVHTTSGAMTPTSVTLASPPAGVTLDAAGVHVAASVAPGVYTLDVRASAGAASAQRDVTLVVAGPVAGYTPVGGGVVRQAATGLFASGPWIEIVAPASRARLDGDAWTTLAEDGSLFRTFSRGTMRLEGRRYPNGQLEVKTVDVGPSGNGTRFWPIPLTGFLPPSVAIDGVGEAWAAVQSNGVHVYRRGTVVGGVPILSGVPGSAAQPQIAAGGTTVIVAVPAASGGLDLRAYNRSTLAFDALPDSGAAPLPDAYAIDVDPSGRPVLAWIGADEQLHVSRFESNTWSSVATFTASPDTIFLSLQLRVDTAGAIVLVAHEAAHTPAPGTWPAPTSRSALRVFRQSGNTFTDTSLAGFAGLVLGFVFDLDEHDRLHLAFSEEAAVTGVVRAP